MPGKRPTGRTNKRMELPSKNYRTKNCFNVMLIWCSIARTTNDDLARKALETIANNNRVVRNENGDEKDASFLFEIGRCSEDFG
jgi:hypothetical protein